MQTVPDMDAAYLLNAPRIVAVTFDMHGGMNPHDPMFVDFVQFLQSFVTTVYDGLAKLYVDRPFLDEVIKKLEARTVMDFRLNMYWNYSVTMDTEGVHTLHVNLHPYENSKIAGYTLQ